MCELYCPADALYTAPDTDDTMLVSESQLTETELLGSYRKTTSWGAGRTSQAGQDQSLVCNVQNVNPLMFVRTVREEASKITSSVSCRHQFIEHYTSPPGYSDDINLEPALKL